MRAILAAICLAGVAACTGPPVMQPSPHDDTSRADGVVAMTSVTGLYQPSQPDWSEADTAALRRCASWGHADQRLAGWRETCRGWDRWGRCASIRVTRYYDCEG